VAVLGATERASAPSSGEIRCRGGASGSSALLAVRASSGKGATAASSSLCTATHRSQSQGPGHAAPMRRRGVPGKVTAAVSAMAAPASVSVHGSDPERDACPVPVKTPGRCPDRSTPRSPLCTPPRRSAPRQRGQVLQQYQPIGLTAAQAIGGQPCQRLLARSRAPWSGRRAARRPRAAPQRASPGRACRSVRLEGRGVSAATRWRAGSGPRRERPDAASRGVVASIPPSSISTAGPGAAMPWRRAPRTAGSRSPRHPAARRSRWRCHLLFREADPVDHHRATGAKSTATRAEATTGTGGVRVPSARPVRRVDFRRACPRSGRCIAPRPRRPRWCRSAG